MTGLGPVSSIGIGKESFWQKASRGIGHFRKVDFPDIELEQYKSRVCSPIDDFNPSDYIEDRRKLKRAARATRYTVVGTFLALQDAGFALKPILNSAAEKPNLYSVDGVDPRRCGVILGQSMDNGDIYLPSHVRFIKHSGPRRMSPITLPQSNSNVGASTTAECFSLRGTNFTIATACSSGTHAIGMAALHIQLGIEDVVITGGAEAPLQSFLFGCFDLLGAMSRNNDDPGKSSRPFDTNRSGFVMGEGAGILVVEELGHALKRGAAIYGEIVGFGFTADAFNIIAPDPYGLAAIEAIRKAMEMARVSPEEIEYINAHGTSTLINDPNETYIIKQVFGDYAYQIPVSSSKSFFGHTIAAAGGLESITLLLAMERGVIPPTSNLDNPDLTYSDESAPELDKSCDLDYVPIEPREKKVGLALTQSFGFGGQNGVLIFKQLDRLP